MTVPVSSVQIQQPVGAYTIGESPYQSLRPGHFVVNPPVITPYSFYDELKKGDNYYKELLKVYASKENHLGKTTNKTGVLKKVLGWGLLVISGLLAYKNRTAIANFFKNLKK